MLRKIHLDFHTAPETENIGRHFNPERFADTLAKAHVNYLATPGKCHFGHVYYDAQVAVPHPHLAEPEMFPRTVTACLQRGIRTQAYWTLGLDATRAQMNPEWRQTFADGTYAHWGHYKHMCFASPYVDEVVLPEVLECLTRCPGIVGFWFDIALYVDGAFYSENFNRLAAGRLGDKSHDVQARWDLARTMVREKCLRIDAAIKEVLPGAENFFNTLVNPAEPQNLGLVHLNEIENPILFNGPEKMTAGIRWLRGQGVPTIGLVSRFQDPWSDPGTLRTVDQMRFDVARTVALGCAVSMGDHRYPDGHLEPEVYRRLAPVYGDVAAIEGLLDQAQPLAEALLVGSVDRAAGHGLLAPALTSLTKHAARVLEELGIQFDIATTADPWPETDCIICLGEEPTAPEMLKRLETHCAGGGAVLAMDHAIEGAGDFFPAAVVPWEAPQTGAVTDMSSIGHVSAVGSDTGDAGPAGDFIRMPPEFGGENVPYLLSQPARILQTVEVAEVLAWRHPPVSARPPFASSQADSPLIAQKGRVTYCSPNLFAEAIRSGSPQPGLIVDAMLSRLLPARLVEHDAGPAVAAHLHAVPDGRLLHLVHWSLDRWEKQVNSSTVFPTLADITVSVQVEGNVRHVYCQPQREELSFAQNGNVATFTLPGLHIWKVVHIEVERPLKP